jgi:hypothetical protein
MNKLPKDMVEKISSELNPGELINFCAGASLNENVKRVCNSDEFWIVRLKRDFSYLFSLFPSLKVNPKNKYLELFSKLSKISEDLSEKVFESFGSFKKYVTAEYKKDLYNYFYNYILDIIKYITDVEDVEDAVFGNDLGDFYNHLPEHQQEERMREYWSEYWSDVIQIPVIDFIKEIFSSLGAPSEPETKIVKEYVDLVKIAKVLKDINNHEALRLANGLTIDRNTVRDLFNRWQKDNKVIEVYGEEKSLRFLDNIEKLMKYKSTHKDETNELFKLNDSGKMLHSPIGSPIGSPRMGLPVLPNYYRE